MKSTPERTHQIVVVDDDLDIQELMIAFFKPRGYRIKCYSDAESALKSAKIEGASWDVLLADLRLPQMSGVELTVELKKDWPDLPVILITTLRSADAAVDAVQKGVYDFIVKPIHFPQLQISVERALRLKSLSSDLSLLRERARTPGIPSHKIIGKSPKFVEALDIARRVAKSKSNIFITGESGTGKEVFARFIHSESPCARGPFVAINCSAIPENLLESELFGHAKGAFTGAQEKKIGLFEEAQDGTLFLDEIGDLSASLQAKLLRVLQERKIKRVGENQLRSINCRIISATHKNLVSEVKARRFREDLFFRLNVIPILLPPLRERQEDLLPLSEAFLRRFSAENDAPARSFSKDAIRFILENPWRGNVRELENAIERAVVLSEAAEISLTNLKPILPAIDSSAESSVLLEAVFSVDCSRGHPPLDDVINQYIDFAVGRNHGARDKTAKEIGIDRKTLYKRLRLNSTEAASEARLAHAVSEGRS
jgi:DNA-binding NtrC family response regulator